MARMTEITCKCGCGMRKEVRTADVRRGWGKYFSKSCKAAAQEKRTGQYNQHRDFLSDHDAAMYDSTASHGQDDTSGI
jgi:hypothetical protein